MTIGETQINHALAGGSRVDEVGSRDYRWNLDHGSPRNITKLGAQECMVETEPKDTSENLTNSSR